MPQMIVALRHGGLGSLAESPPQSGTSPRGMRPWPRLLMRTRQDPAVRTLLRRARRDRQDDPGGASRGRRDQTPEYVSDVRRLTVCRLGKPIRPDPPFGGESSNRITQLTEVAIPMGRPGTDCLKRCDLVERQLKAMGIPANVKANAVDPGRRRADYGNLIDRGYLCGDAQRPKSGPAGRAGAAIASHFERDIYGTGTGLPEAALDSAKVETLAGPHNRRG